MRVAVRFRVRDVVRDDWPQRDRKPNCCSGQCKQSLPLERDSMSGRGDERVSRECDRQEKTNVDTGKETQGD